jgi:FG-GAP repeat protein
VPPAPEDEVQGQAQGHEQGNDRVSARLLRQPRTVLALTAAIVGFGVFSSSVGIGALPTSTLPVYGVTNGDGSRATVAELGDVNGDGIGDYAVGMPSADVAGSADAGIVYVFLGHAGALPPVPGAINLATASFRINGHAGEMLGFSVVGDDVNDDGRADIAIGAPMAGAPGKSGGGAVYVIFGTANPRDVSTTTLSFAGLTNAPTNPATPSPIGSRYDGFQENSHTGMSLAALADVNGDGFNDLAVGAPDADLHITGGGGVAVLYGKSHGVHITLNDLWEAGYPYFFHVDYPARDGTLDQHVGESVASVGDMTGDGWPDIAIGAPQADFNGRTDSGSVWIISGHLPPIGPGCSGMNVDNSCPWLRLYQLTASQGYRIDGAQAGDGLGSSLAGVGDQNGDGIPDLAIGASAASPNGRSSSGEVVVVAGQRESARRDLATAPPLQRIDGAAAGAGLGAALAAAGDVDGDGRVDLLAGAPGEASFAGAAYLVRGSPGAVSDLSRAPSKIAPGGAGAQVGSSVAAGFSLDGAGRDALVAAPGAAGAFVVGGSGTPVLPGPAVSVPPAPAAAPPAPPVTTTTPEAKPAAGPVANPAAKPTVKKKHKKLPLCPRKKPKPRYKIVKGKRVKVKPAPCRPRPKTTAKVKAKAK